MVREYQEQNVYEALMDRFKLLFEEFDNIYVSFSGGKDSGLLLNLVLDYRNKYYPEARGSHDVDLMSNIVKELHELGRSDAWISKHLGMDKDEILRLKQITGLAALFKDVKFGKAWVPAEEEEEQKA